MPGRQTGPEHLGRRAEPGRVTSQCDGAAGSSEKRILLKFVLDGLPPGSCVRDAHLRLWSKTQRSAEIGFVLHGLDPDGWDHGTANWETQPRTGPVLATAQGAPAGAWVNFDLTGTVRANAGYAFALHSTGSAGGYFASREDTTLEHPAELVVEHTRCPR